MADLIDPFGLLFDHTDGDTGRNFDVVPLADGAVEVRIFAPGTTTTSRRVTLDAELVARLQLALAGHLRANRLRERVDELIDQLDAAHAQIMSLGGIMARYMRDQYLSSRPPTIIWPEERP